MIQTDDDGEPLRKKNITGILLGNPDDDEFDFDTPAGERDLEAENAPDEPEDLSGDNALVNVLDLFISTSPMVLNKYDLPSPDLTIWREWARPNLNTAMNHYFPAGSGSSVSTPLMAAFIGIAALGLTFLPIILRLVDKKKQEEKEKGIKIQPAQAQEDAAAEQTAPVIVQEPTDSTAPISEHQQTVAERMASMEEQVV